MSQDIQKVLYEPGETGLPVLYDPDEPGKPVLYRARVAIDAADASATWNASGSASGDETDGVAAVYAAAVAAMLAASTTTTRPTTSPTIGTLSRLAYRYSFTGVSDIGGFPGAGTWSLSAQAACWHARARLKSLPRVVGGTTLPETAAFLAQVAKWVATAAMPIRVLQVDGAVTKGVLSDTCTLHYGFTLGGTPATGQDIVDACTQSMAADNAAEANAAHRYKVTDDDASLVAWMVDPDLAHDATGRTGKAFGVCCWLEATAHVVADATFSGSSATRYVNASVYQSVAGM
jgi:hypothetical protein